MNGPERAPLSRRCRKRKGTYSKVGNVFAALALNSQRCANGRLRRDSPLRVGRTIVLSDASYITFFLIPKQAYT